MTTQHTPTPWKLTSKCLISGDTVQAIANCGEADGIGDYTAPLPNEVHANAAFIVRACNAHEEIVYSAKEAADVLEELLQEADPLSPLATKLERRARDLRTAIAKAEGK